MGIPLVSLAVHAPDPVQNAAGSMQLRQLAGQNAMIPGQLQAQQQQIQGGQQQLQLGKQAIQQGEYANQDREAGMKAMQQWSGKDLNELPDLIQKNGGSMQAVLGAKKSAIEAQQQVMNLNTAQLTQAKTKNDYLLGKLQAATDKSIPDDQLPQSVMAATQQAIKDGFLDPPHAQEVQQLIQQFPDPTELRNHLSIYEKGLMSQTEQFNQETKNRETAADEQKANAADWKDFPTMGVALNTRTGEVKTPAGQAMSPQMMEGKYVAIQQKQKLGQPLTPEEKAFTGAYANLKSLVPTTTFNLQNATPGGPNAPLSDKIVDAVGAQGSQLKLSDVLPARAPASVRQAALNQILAKYPDFNSGDFTTEQKVKQQYTSGDVGKQLLAINTAREHMKTFGSLADALDNDDVAQWNKLGNAVGVQLGRDKATNFKIAAQAFGGEVGKALDGAGVTAGEREQAQEAFNPNMSPDQFRGAIKTVDALLAGKQKAAQETYDTGTKTAKPNFGGGQSGGPSASATTRIKASDGSLHDIPTANLDKARKIDPKLQVIQ
jgi:hypothetical protein